jgi:CO/xanthine dehydrogenase Mo-binding subunit
MTTSSSIPRHVEEALYTHRRGFLKSAGLLVVSFAAGGGLVSEAIAEGSTAAQPSGPYPNPDFHQLDAWIVIHENNTATFYVGKTDLGQGTGTGFRQLMSDELDIAFDRTTCIMGSTDITVDQGGSGGSSAMERDSWPMRRAAAEARRALLEMASEHLGTPVDQLAVSNAVITVKANPLKRVTYGELIAGKKFNITLTGANVNAVTGAAKVKPVQELKYTGQPLERDDIPAKVDGSQKWAVDVNLPGMVHARNVKPPFACAKLTGIDESSVRKLPGFVKMLRKGNYVAVVCEREEQAIRAARELKATWEKPATAPFPASEDLFHYMRAATPTSTTDAIVAGNPDTAFSGAANVIEAEYEVPFQGHTAIAGAHAMADPSNGQMTIYSNDMKAYGMRRGVAAFLDMPQEKVRVIWMQGPQAFGRTAADDAGFEAAWIARENRPSGPCAVDEK